RKRRAARSAKLLQLRLVVGVPGERQRAKVVLQVDAAAGIEGLVRCIGWSPCRRGRRAVELVGYKARRQHRLTVVAFQMEFDARADRRDGTLRQPRFYPVGRESPGHASWIIRDDEMLEPGDVFVPALVLDQYLGGGRTHRRERSPVHHILVYADV